jgi:hypothetical protein
VSFLDVDVPTVRLGDVVRLQTAQVVAVHENRHVIPLVDAAVGSHCDGIAIFAGSGFDSRLAFGVHLCARDDYFGKRLFVRARNAPGNGGKYLLLVVTAADRGTTAERACGLNVIGVSGHSLRSRTFSSLIRAGLPTRFVMALTITGRRQTPSE